MPSTGRPSIRCGSTDVMVRNEGDGCYTLFEDVDVMRFPGAKGQDRVEQCSVVMVDHCGDPDQTE